jgi:hypothetical protein
MTIHEMLHQVSLSSGGKFSRTGDVSALEIRLPGDRKQVIFGKVEQYRGTPLGVLYTYIGELTDNMNPVRFLELNSRIRYSRIGVENGKDIILISTFNLMNTSINECAPLLQELAAVADKLENAYFEIDAS